MISTLVSLPYRIARLPLVLVDSRLSDVLPETSAPRVTFDRALGSADKLAGRLTGDREIARRGTERLDRLDKLATAARLEQEADARRDQADEVFREAGEQAERKRVTARARIASAPDKAQAAQAHAEQEARLEARTTAAAEKQAADERAVKVVESAEQQRKRKEAAAAARRRAAQRKAAKKTDDARETEEAAAQAREEAEQLGELTEAKKQERQQN